MKGLMILAQNKGIKRKLNDDLRLSKAFNKYRH